MRLRWYPWFLYISGGPVTAIGVDDRIEIVAEFEGNDRKKTGS